jgi:hypothetical protein
MQQEADSAENVVSAVVICSQLPLAMISVKKLRL